jgi:hypothetical protein
MHPSVEVMGLPSVHLDLVGGEWGAGLSGGRLTASRATVLTYHRLTMPLRLLTWLAALLIAPGAALAQDRPFVFSTVATAAEAARRLVVDVDFGAGDQVFRSESASGPEQRVGVRAFLGRLEFIGQVGLASISGAYDSSQQGEMLVSLLPARASAVSLAAGGGLLHEAGGVNVWLGRVVAARQTTRTRLAGNLLLQKPRAVGRDALDVMTTLGWSARITDAVAVGAEAIGEDLEGFWEPDEAEGGARLLVGPSLHVAPRGRRWEVSVAGGPVFHPTTSNRLSAARRDLPPVTGTSYAARVGFTCRFGD